MSDIPPPIPVLILGGTAEARELAATLVSDPRWSIISSVAGRTRNRSSIEGAVRIGGFGGIPGLAAYITENGIQIVIDATHPYADTISANAEAACDTTGCRYIRLCRPPWQPASGDRWLVAQSGKAAADLLEPSTTALLTIGQKDLAPFFARGDTRLIARMIEAPAERPPGHVTIILDRPPFTLENELTLMRSHAVDVLVTKNAGSPLVAEKLAAARDLGLPVIMIARPTAQPPVDAATVAEATALLDHHDT